MTGKTCATPSDCLSGGCAGGVCQSFAQLTVQLSGKGAGQITEPGLTCSGTVCTGQYRRGAIVALEPLPDARSSFSGWTGACSGAAACNVMMDNDHVASASFDLKRLQLSLTAKMYGGGSGAVSSNRQASPAP